MELNRNLCAFSAGSKALRAGRYNGDAKAIVLCVAHNFHERQRVYFHFYFLFYFRKLNYLIYTFRYSFIRAQRYEKIAASQNISAS